MLFAFVRVTHPFLLARRSYVDWSPSPCIVCTDETAFGGYEKAAACFSTSKAIAPLLDRCLEKASEMLAADAFLHQYETYGLPKSEFLVALATLEQVAIIAHGCCYHAIITQSMCDSSAFL